MTFAAVPAPHRYRWVVFLALIGGGVLLGGWFVVQQPFSLFTYLLGLGVVVLALTLAYLFYRLLALALLRYEVDRDALRVRWGWSTFVVPMHEIQAVYPPGRLQPLPSSPWWTWPARHVWTRDVEGRTWYMFGTQPPEHMWLFWGQDFCLGISPRDGERMLREVNRRRALGVNRRLRRGWQRPGLARWRFWSDTYALLGWLAGLVFLLLLWGEVARRAELLTPWRLAQLGTLLLGIDWVLGLLLYRRERLAALALWWAGSALLVVLLLGLWTTRI